MSPSTPPALRPELEALPVHMRALPIDTRGYPVPWFVEWIDGRPEFRVMSRDKWRAAVRDRLCWVCGGKLGRHQTFVIGPMCAINRTTAEPPSHTNCATWSARNCPFLSRPDMVRREDALTEELEKNVAGDMIKRNPGVTLLWTTRHYSTFSDGRGGLLIEIGDPESVVWYARGRLATRAEVREAIESGLPLLRDVAQHDGPAGLAELERRAAGVELLYPLEEGSRDATT